MSSLAELVLRVRRPTVDALMLGTAPLASLYHNVPLDDAVRVVRAALEAGVTLIDSAPLYGMGDAEWVIGEALRQHAHALSERGKDVQHELARVRLWTKAGRVLYPRGLVEQAAAGNEIEWDALNYYFHKNDNVSVVELDEAGVRKSLAQSDERLAGVHRDAPPTGVPAGAPANAVRVPVYGLRLHDAENEARFALATAPGAAVDALVRLRQEGRVHDVGLGMNLAAYHLRYVRMYPARTFDSLMVAGCWNLLDQTGMELFRECQARGVRVHNAGVFGSGILWGGSKLRYNDAPSEAHETVAKWRQLTERYNVPLPAVALHFAFLPSVVQYVAFGCSSVDRLQANLALLQHDVPVRLWADAVEAGLLPAGFPTIHDQ